MRNVIPTLLSIGLLSLPAFLSSGCYQDMLKATPFGRGATEGAEDRIALWPLFYHRGSATSFLWPMGEVTEDSWAIRPLVAVYGQRADLLWPFIHVDGEKGGGYFAPLVGWRPGPDGFLWTPLVGWRSGESGWLYTPLYTFGWGPDRRWRLVPPILTWWGSEDDGASWFGSPLYLEVRDAESVDQALPVLLSWWDRSVDGDWSANVLLSAFGMTRSTEQSSEHLFPLYWRGWREREDGRSEWLALIPLYARVRGRDGFQLDGLPFLLSARTVTPSGNPGWHLLLSAVAWGSRPTGGDAPDASFHRVFPFYWYDRDTRRTGFGILPPLYAHSVRDTGAWNVDYLWILGGISSSKSREASHFFPLYSWSRRQIETPDDSDPGDEPQSPRVVEEIRFDLLFYLYDQLRERYEDGEEYHRHRVLWRLYHDEARADSRSIDIFPFIAYDRSGEEELTWSWLYKLIRYERRGAEKKLYLFFLPALTW